MSNNNQIVFPQSKKKTVLKKIFVLRRKAITITLLLDIQSVIQYEPGTLSYRIVIDSSLKFVRPLEN